MALRLFCQRIAKPIQSAVMDTIKQRIKQVKARIQRAQNGKRRQQRAVKLLAVSKTKPAADIVMAYQAGQRHFGESYLQEALVKQSELAAFAISWHFIGPIQSNKTKAIAHHFSWVHSVDRLKIANRLSEQRPAGLPALNILVQVNISAATTKSGVSVAELAPLIRAVKALPGIRLRGIMAIPEPSSGYAAQRKPYAQLMAAVKQLNSAELDEFSFGMSADLEAAIAEGATLVRVGSALFGARQ